MPQATEAQRKKWGTDGGVGEGKAIQFLQAAGYHLTRGRCWVKPSPSHVPTEEELGAMSFLIDEWDFGGITTEVQ